MRVTLSLLFWFYLIGSCGVVYLWEFLPGMGLKPFYGCVHGFRGWAPVPIESLRIFLVITIAIVVAQISIKSNPKTKTGEGLSDDNLLDSVHVDSRSTDEIQSIDNVLKGRASDAAAAHRTSTQRGTLQPASSKKLVVNWNIFYMCMLWVVYFSATWMTVRGTSKWGIHFLLTKEGYSIMRNTCVISDNPGRSALKALEIIIDMDIVTFYYWWFFTNFMIVRNIHKRDPFGLKHYFLFAPTSSAVLSGARMGTATASASYGLVPTSASGVGAYSTTRSTQPATKRKCFRPGRSVVSLCNFVQLILTAYVTCSKLVLKEVTVIHLVWSFRYLAFVLWVLTFMFDSLCFGVPCMPEEVLRYLKQIDIFARGLTGAVESGGGDTRGFHGDAEKAFPSSDAISYGGGKMSIHQRSGSLDPEKFRSCSRDEKHDIFLCDEPGGVDAMMPQNNLVQIKDRNRLGVFKDIDQYRWTVQHAYGLCAYGIANYAILSFWFLATVDSSYNPLEFSSWNRMKRSGWCARNSSRRFGTNRLGANEGNSDDVCGSGSDIINDLAGVLRQWRVVCLSTAAWVVILLMIHFKRDEIRTLKKVSR